MSKKSLYIIIAILVLVVAGGGIFWFINNKSGEKTPSSAESENSNPISYAGTENESSALSEQPNQAKYNEYFSDIFLGKMAIGKNIGVDGFPTKTNTFTSGADLLCTMMTLKKTIVSGHIATAIYDVVAKADNVSKTVFPMEMKAGGNGGCSNLTQTAGKYEYKIYVDDVLAVVLPFEVK